MNLTQLDTAVDHVIIGLDYGTTGTAIWIMIVPRGKSIEESSHYLTNWPSSNETRVDAIKVPSRIAFPVDNPSFSMRSTHWGFGINPGMNSYFWTKLLLEEHTGLGEFDDEVLMSTALKGDLHPAFRSVDCQDPEKVILDYLGHVLEFTRGHLKERPDINFDFASVHLQFTTPASWSKKAQELSEWAVKRAWWFRRNHDTLTVLSEPEAASKAICQSLQGEFKTGDGILICDCGGGTVVSLYLSWYIMMFHYLPFGHDPWMEIPPKQRAKCGGVAIDNRLFSLMKKHMPDAFGHLNHLIAPGSIFMDSFEKLKRDFDEGLPYHCFKLPLQVRRGRATCDPRYYNSSAFEFYLRYDDVRSLFDPVIFNIIRLINSQIKVANLEYGSPVINIKRLIIALQKIVLVGGLGSSTYVQRVIRQALESSQKLCVMVPMAIDP
ncbi:actin-like ATPase domain-containing protein [Penicillium manginii]|uniref:actin-like ATPase domain-containing protein n=1 Tax=Penicillium manginii TaxID=203109 RepID=UPI00254955CD|nr:actin-like ATPase domain-containing protein [Penicillium manginii]KAJ5742912.1 actin-like ATPase domain-containing protein [Penicillium manginii]